MPTFKNQVPKMVTDIYREVLKLSQNGNDIFFQFDSQFKTISVRGYLGNTFFRDRKPIINEVAVWDRHDSLCQLMEKLKNVYDLDETKERYYGPAKTTEEDMESE